MDRTDPEYRTTYKEMKTGALKGRTKIYYYTKPGGTRFFDVMDHALTKPFPDAFKRAYREALDDEAPNQLEGDCAQLIVDYLNSPKFEKLSASSRKSYTRCLGMARDKFGTASIKVMEDRRFKQKVLRWHEHMANASPRGADTTISVFRTMLGYAKKRGLLMWNPAEAIDNAYTPPNDKQPWTAQEIEKFLAGSDENTQNIFMLAMHTGLRRTDLVNLPWDAWKGSYIEYRTSKSRYQRTVLITLLDEAQQLLKRMKRLQLESPLGLQRTIVVSDLGRSMTPAGIDKKINSRAHALGISKTIHRLRNNRCILLIEAEFEDETIASEMGWTIDDVKQMKQIYAGSEVIIAARVRKLKKAQNENGTNKPLSEN